MQCINRRGVVCDIFSNCRLLQNRLKMFIRGNDLKNSHLVNNNRDKTTVYGLTNLVHFLRFDSDVCMFINKYVNFECLTELVACMSRL